MWGNIHHIINSTEFSRIVGSTGDGGISDPAIDKTLQLLVMLVWADQAAAAYLTFISIFFVHCLPT